MRVPKWIKRQVLSFSCLPGLLVVLASCQQGVSTADGDTSPGPSFDTTVNAQTYTAGSAITPLVLPATTGGSAPLTYY
jgi:hypothetical protein